MPYITQEDRKKFELLLSCLPGETPSTPGELNYIISVICSYYVLGKGERYQAFNDVIGALEGAKLEFYRECVAKYEDIKLKENGNIKP